jgi:hypothetical protein
MPPDYAQIFLLFIEFLFTILPFSMLQLEFKLVQILRRSDGEKFLDLKLRIRIFTILPCVLIITKSFIYQLMQNRFALKEY